MITDNPRAGAVSFAESHQIPVHIIRPSNYPASKEFGLALLKILKSVEAAWVVLAGYLKKIPDNVIAAYANRIVNIHPALLPAFGGAGMYGMKVHEAVYKAGVKVSGVTVHLVNEEYDAGPIVFQRAVDIADCQSPEEIAERVLQEEHRAFPEALRLLLENSFSVDGRRVKFHE